jgi:hypothetical protein
MYLGGHSRDYPEGGQSRADALTAWDPAGGKVLRRFADPTASQVDPRFAHFGRQVNPLAVSPDGRLLAAAEGPGSGKPGVWLYETATGKVIEKMTGHTRAVTDLAFSPDGRRLVSVSSDQTGLVWDVTLSALGGKQAVARPAEAWDRLARVDPGPAYGAMAALAAAPAEAVTLLRARLRPAAVPTDADLDRVVKQLGAEAFAVREKASAELERFGANAVAGAKARLDRAASLEVRGRLTWFLDQYDGPDPSPHLLRCVRGVAILETIGTTEARALLAELAQGPADEVLTREARSASHRKGSR